MPTATFSHESAAQAKGFRAIAGVDEAGRGPLAGPVTAAAVILDPAVIPPGLADSKTLSHAKREALYAEILASARAVAVASVSPASIDRDNIRMASLTAMRLAVSALAERADFALIDGRDIPPGLPCQGQAIIEGDALSLSIAAASIVAKVTRDRLMRRLGEAHPAYAFERHMGYGTAAHKAALGQHGPSPHHRFSFAPVKALRHLTPA